MHRRYKKIIERFKTASPSQREVMYSVLARELNEMGQVLDAMETMLHGKTETETETKDLSSE